MIPKVCFVCGDEHPQRKTTRYVVRRPTAAGRSSKERAVELCKEHREDLEKYLEAPARGTRHTLKAYPSFAAFQRAEKAQMGTSTSRGR